MERQPHDEMAGQVRPDGGQHELPLHTNGCQTRSSIDPKPPSFSCAGVVNCNKNGEHLGENVLLLLPEVFGLRWLVSINVFGAGQP